MKFSKHIEHRLEYLPLFFDPRKKYTNIVVQFPFEPPRTITNDLQYALESKGILVSSGHPLHFDYRQVLSSIAPVGRENKFIGGAIDVLFSELGICMGIDKVNSAWANYLASSQKLETFLRINDPKGLAELTKAKNEGRGFNGGILETKWYLDASVIRIRAQWDKLLRFLAEDYLNFRFSSKRLGEYRDKGRIGELSKKMQSSFSSPDQIASLNLLIDLLLDLGELQKYRTGELHSYSMFFEGALGYKGAPRVETYLEFLAEQHNKVREGLLLALAIPLLANP